MSQIIDEAELAYLRREQGQILTNVAGIQLHLGMIDRNLERLLERLRHIEIRIDRMVDP